MMPPSKETLPSAAGPIRVDVYSPTPGGRHPAVLVLHGTLGLEPPVGKDIESFAEALNAKGIAAAIPRYFDSTGTKAGDEALQTMLDHLPAWKLASNAAMTFMTGDTRFDPKRLGLLGFSLGGHLALNLAMARPAGATIKGLVEFFAPTIQPRLRGDWLALPPVLIHHGTSDPLTIENSRNLISEMGKVGRKVSESTFGKSAPGPLGDDQFIEYPGETHGFKGAALSGSRDSTIQFLETHLTQ